jgi:hypothetical protein
VTLFRSLDFVFFYSDGNKLLIYQKNKGGKDLNEKDLKPPYPGTLRFEVFVHRLRIRIVSQGGTRGLSVGFRGCFFFRVCFSTGFTFYVCVYISFGYIYMYVSLASPAQDVLSFLSNIGFTVYHSLLVTFLFPGLHLFLFGRNKKKSIKRCS